MKHSKGKQQKVKAVIYARQSSGEEEQSASVAQQIVNCQKLAIENDIEIVGTYQDLNISGKTYPDTTEAAALAAVDIAYTSWVKSTYDKSQRYRKGLGEVMAILKTVDYILLDDFTRLMRPLPSSYLEGYISQQLKQNGIKLLCVKGGTIDTSSFTDNLVTTIISQINANQIEIQRAKSMDALRKLRDNGYRPTGSDLRGYKRTGNQTYEIVLRDAEVIKEAYRLGLEYIPYQQICRALSKQFGYKALTYKFLQGIYKRPEYAGYQYNSQGELIESKCFGKIPIITLLEFQQMQARFNNKLIHNRDRKETYAVSGLCYCGYCGGRMQIISADPFPTSKEEGRLHSFACIRNVHSHDTKNNCGKARIRYQYKNPINNKLAPADRTPVTETALKSVYAPKEFQNLGLFESLMPLVALHFVNELRQLLQPENVQEELNELRINEQKRLDFEKNLADMLYRREIDNAQFITMAADSKARREKDSQRSLELAGRVSIDKEKEEEKILTMLFLLRKRYIDKNKYKKYAQMIIDKITLFAYYILIDFKNGKQLKLERIPNRCARVLPDWSLEIKNNKAHITYFYKSFFSGDKTKAVIYDDESMKIMTIGTNPIGGAYIRKREPNSKRTQAFLKRIADT